MNYRPPEYETAEEAPKGMLRRAHLRQRGFLAKDYDTPLAAGHAARRLFADLPHHQTQARNLAYSDHPQERRRIAALTRQAKAARPKIGRAELRRRGFNPDDHPTPAAAGQAARALAPETSNAYETGYMAHPDATAKTKKRWRQITLAELRERGFNENDHPTPAAAGRAAKALDGGNPAAYNRGYKAHQHLRITGQPAPGETRRRRTAAELAARPPTAQRPQRGPAPAAPPTAQRPQREPAPPAEENPPENRPPPPAPPPDPETEQRKQAIREQRAARRRRDLPPSATLMRGRPLR